MKRISEDQLTRAALAKGAVVRLNGRTLNAAAERMVVAAPEPAPTPAPTPPPEPAPQVDLTEMVQTVSQGQASVDKLAVLVAALVKEMRAQQQPAPKPIVKWVFDVTKNGSDMKITATAIR